MRKGKEVFFCGYNGYEKDAVAKGWLRVSHRALDPEKSRPSRPYHAHERLEKLVPGRIVPVEIEILPSSTWFEADTRLELSVLGTDGAKYPAFKHKNTVNRGKHSIYCGGRYRFASAGAADPRQAGLTRFKACRPGGIKASSSLAHTT